MLGFRGASRYTADRYRRGSPGVPARQRVREEMGLANVIVMIPFCRTLKESGRVLEVLGDNGLKRVRAGLEVYVMAEIPSNVILAEKFAERFDGFSIAQRLTSWCWEWTGIPRNLPNSSMSETRR